MSTAIIVATHGVAAEQLLRTTEMLVGEQSNVEYVTFLPSENAETLKAKYEAIIKTKLADKKNILFLVDMFGGSPYNAAVALATDNDKYEVISGVNIPMLANTVMQLEDGLSLTELAKLALEAGKEGVKALKTQDPIMDQQNISLSTKPPSSSKPQVVTDGNHVKIALARIDDRLIHGQVATLWTKETGVNRIVVVSDEVAKDVTRSTLLKQVAPPGVTSHVVSIDKMVRVYNNPEYSNDKIMLLFTNPTDALELIKKGVKITSLNIGGTSYKEGKTQITSAVSVDKKDIAAYEELNRMGIELEVRKVSNDTQHNMMDLLKKNNLL